MGDKVTVAIFAANNLNGMELGKQVAEMVSREFDMQPEIYSQQDSKMSKFMSACYHKDIVVFDGSAEEGHIYSVPGALPSAMYHVLVVSRTPLPINFCTIHEGGVPDFPTQDLLSNEDLTKWLNTQISNKLGTKPRKNKGFLKQWSVMGSSLDRRKVERKTLGQIFISFRSDYYNDGVSRLQYDLKRGKYHNNQAKTSFALPPGNLLFRNEIFNELRFWQLAEMIDDRLAVAEELWVYNTSDYLKSWWTRAELVMASFRKHTRKEYPKIRIFDPNKESVQDAPPDFLPHLSHDQIKRIDRLGANSHPCLMLPHAAELFTILGNTPLFGSFSYFKDHVWGESFSLPNHPIMLCRVCRDQSLESNKWDIDKFLSLSEPGLIHLTPSQIDSTLNGKPFTCACGTRYIITKDDRTRYLWMPDSIERPSQRTTPFLFMLPIYRSQIVS